MQLTKGSSQPVVNLAILRLHLNSIIFKQHCNCRDAFVLVYELWSTIYKIVLLIQLKLIDSIYKLDISSSIIDINWGRESVVVGKSRVSSKRPPCSAPVQSDSEDKRSLWKMYSRPYIFSTVFIDCCGNRNNCFPSLIRYLCYLSLINILFESGEFRLDRISKWRLITSINYILVVMSFDQG